MSKESGSIHHHTSESIQWPFLLNSWAPHHFYWLIHFKKTEHWKITCSFKYSKNRDLEENHFWKREEIAGQREQGFWHLLYLYCFLICLLFVLSCTDKKYTLWPGGQDRLRQEDGGGCFLASSVNKTFLVKHQMSTGTNW